MTMRKQQSWLEILYMNPAPSRMPVVFCSCRREHLTLTFFIIDSVLFDGTVILSMTKIGIFFIIACSPTLCYEQTEVKSWYIIIIHHHELHSPIRISTSLRTFLYNPPFFATIHQFLTWSFLKSSVTQSVQRSLVLSFLPSL